MSDFGSNDGQTSLGQKLKISDTVYAQLRKHGEETYPHECCGVLLGKALDGINEVEVGCARRQYADRFRP